LPVITEFNPIWNSELFP